MGSPTSKMNAATNGSTNSPSIEHTGTVSNLKWWSQITGNYPKRTTEQERDTLDAARADLNAFDIAIAGAVKSYWSREQGYAFPGHRTIADGARVDKDTVSSRIKRLEDAGWLHVWRRPGRAGWRYYLRSPLDGMSRESGDNDEQEECPVDDMECPDDAPTMSREPGDLTREQEIEQQTATPSGWSESRELTTFLDVWAAKLDASVSEAFAKQRRAAHNRHNLRESEALVNDLGEGPHRTAVALWRSSWRFNNATKSPLGMLLKALRTAKEDRGRVPRNVIDDDSFVEVQTTNAAETSHRDFLNQQLAKLAGRRSDAFADDQPDPNHALDSIDRWGKTA